MLKQKQSEVDMLKALPFLCLTAVGVGLIAPPVMPVSAQVCNAATVTTIAGRAYLASELDDVLENTIGCRESNPAVCGSEEFHQLKSEFDEHISALVAEIAMEAGGRAIAPVFSRILQRGASLTRGQLARLNSVFKRFRKSDPALRSAEELAEDMGRIINGSDSAGAGSIRDASTTFYSGVGQTTESSRFVEIWPVNPSGGRMYEDFIFHRGHAFQYMNRGSTQRRLAQSLGFNKISVSVSNLPIETRSALMSPAPNGRGLSLNSTVEIFEVPRVSRLNSGIEALPASKQNGLSFTPVHGEVSPQQFVDELAQGKIIIDDVPTEMGMTGLHLHDTAGHAMGYISLPKNLVNRLQSEAGFFKNFINRMNGSVYGLNQSTKASIESIIEKESRQFVDSVDGLSMAASNRIGRGDNAQVIKDAISSKVYPGTNHIYSEIEEKIARNEIPDLDNTQKAELLNWLQQAKNESGTLKATSGASDEELLNWATHISNF